MFFLFLTLFELSQNAVSQPIQDSSSATLPNVFVYDCNDEIHQEWLQIDTLSKGNVASATTTLLHICRKEKYLSLHFKAYDQEYFSAEGGSKDSCNDAIFDLSVLEFFIGPKSESNNMYNAPTPFCYSELDINPYNKAYFSGIFNKYRNASSLEHHLIDCNSSGIKHNASIIDGFPLNIPTDGDSNTLSWTVVMDIPFEEIICPNGCPYCSATTDFDSVVSKGDSFRFNAYRIAELQDGVSSCSTETCEYVAFSPTYDDPPAFHEPSQFAYLILA